MKDEFSHEWRAGRRRWPWVLLILGLAIVVGTQAYRLFLQSQIRREVAAIQQEGFPTTSRDLQAWRGPIPATENAALRILEATDYLPPSGFGQTEWPSSTEEMGPEQRDEFSEIVTNNAPALEILHRAASLKAARYPVDYSRGPGTLLPHLAKVKGMTQLLRAEALVHAEEGRLQNAADSTIAGVALARSLESEPLLISQLVRIAGLSITVAGLERTLNQHALGEEQLAALAAAFRGAREASQKAYRESYIGELCMGVYCFQARPRETLQMFNSDNEVSPWVDVLYPVYAWSGIRDRDYLFYVRIMRGLLDAAKVPFPQGLQEIETVNRKIEDGVANHRLLIFSKMLLPAITTVGRKVAESEAQLLCTEAGIAVEQFRRKNDGALPGDLPAALGPELAKVLRDPFDGAPLRFEKRQRGYVVYSIGPDRADDGGMPRERDPKRRGGGRAPDYDVTFTVER